MFHYMNTFEFDKLSEYMHEICAPDFQVVIKKEKPFFAFAATGAEKPTTAVVDGVDAYVNLNASLASCVPDRVYALKETIIRNRPDSMVIMSKFVISGSLVSKMKTNDPDMLSNDGKDLKIKESNFNPEIVYLGEEKVQRNVSECTGTLQLDKDRKVHRMFIDYTTDRNKNWIKMTTKKRKRFLL